MTDLNTPLGEIQDPAKALAAVLFRLSVALGREPVGNDIEGYVLEFNPELLLTAAEVAIIASETLPGSAAAVWAEAIEAARQVMNRRTGTYEADIDILALENPYGSSSPAPIAPFTVHELEQLPHGTVVIDENDDVHQLATRNADGTEALPGDWECMSEIGILTSSHEELLAEHPTIRIIYVPKAT